MHLPQGTLLQGGKYRIESVLGQGGFGITYRAVNTAFDEVVAGFVVVFAAVFLQNYISNSKYRELLT